jgi:hypothetical protein
MINFRKWAGVCALVFVFAVSAIAQPSAQPLILSPGYYGQSTPIDANSSDFRFVIEFLKTNTGLAEPQLVAPPYANGGFAPHQLIFTCRNGQTQAVDAVLTFQRPDISVLNIEQGCGVPATWPGMYSKPIPPPDVVAPAAKPTVLVGDCLDPVAYPDWFHGVTGDDSPDGKVYRDSRGAFVKVITRGPFGNSVRWHRITP